MTTRELIRQLQALVEAEPALADVEVYVYSEPHYGDQSSAPLRRVDILSAGRMVHLTGDWSPL